MSVSLGQRAETIRPYQLADSLFASLAISALLSAGLALYQWFGLDMLGVLVPAMEGGGRAVANIAQPNNLSTLLVWGLLALWWAHSRRHIGGVGAILGAGFLLLGLVLTGSRTGLIQVSFLGVAAVLGRRTLRTEQQVAPFALLALWLVFLVMALPPLSEALWGSAARPTAEIVKSGVRPTLWLMALEGLADRPMLGFGWNQTVTVHVVFASKFPGLGETMGHAHNVLLDLLLWNGIPLGLVIIGGFGWWGWKQVRAASTGPHLLLLLVLGVFLIHAMLELPHLYAFFLLPVALVMGIISALSPKTSVFTLSRAVIGFVGWLLAVGLTVMFSDYRLIETNLTAHRMKAARIAGADDPVPPDILILKPLQRAFDVLRTSPKRNMSAEDLDDLRRTVIRYPGSVGLYNYAQSAALNGRPDDARWALDLICNLRGPAFCNAAIKDWQEIGMVRYPEMSAIVLPSPGRSGG